MTGIDLFNELNKSAGTTILDGEQVGKFAEIIRQYASASPRKRDTISERIAAWLSAHRRARRESRRRALYYLSDKLEQLARWVRWLA